VAWGLLGETLGVFQIVGGLIVLSGALLAQTATASATPAPAAEAEGAVAVSARG
jgi:drug/metabolite transporter (DMT)-like permease